MCLFVFQNCHLSLAPILPVGVLYKHNVYSKLLMYHNQHILQDSAGDCVLGQMHCRCLWIAIGMC